MSISQLLQLVGAMWRNQQEAAYETRVTCATYQNCLMQLEGSIKL